MDLAIIAAGQGLRLKEEGINIPKPLVEINGVPVIQRIIDLALKNGFNSIVCIINEESEELERFLHENCTNHPLNLVVKSTPSSFHSLYQLSRFTASPFLLTTTDSVFKEKEFSAFLDYGLNKNDADAVLAVTNFIDDEKPLYAEVEKDLRIVSLTDNNKDCEFVTGGLYLFNKDIKKYVDEAAEQGVNRLRNFLRYLLQKELRMYSYPFSKIIDVDHVLDIKKAEDFLLGNYN
ncbi:MAG: sugar phosphate nucleotidyltransferase [Melioribacteraceae bacterium]|jgi:NDP-sugar pyrophosphorylase family protein|nr:sugar phosphate nucleotidyltransferase [Melioribacteraceae bacterium]WKZ70051.1 MAG: sugar phosphate nucleotidyltransferase [Melioribacteraceae bacterium]